MAQVNDTYSFKDAYRLLRAVAAKAEEIADSKEQMIITQLEKLKKKCYYFRSYKNYFLLFVR